MSTTERKRGRARERQRGREKREAGGEIRKHETRDGVKIGGDEVIDGRQWERKAVKEERFGWVRGKRECACRCKLKRQMREAEGLTETWDWNIRRAQADRNGAEKVRGSRGEVTEARKKEKKVCGEEIRGKN